MTGSRLVETVDGDEYIAKNDGWGSDAVEGTHVLLQEWICHRLACAVGVPVPDYSLLDYWGTICFGSRKLQLYAKQFADRLLDRVANPEAIYSVAVFDTWVLNRDRHKNNLVIATQGSHQLLVAIDHSHCPLYGAEPFEMLAQHRDGLAVEVLKDYLPHHLVEREPLARMVHRVQNLTDDDIRALTSPPDAIPCSAKEHEELADFLIYRRDNVRDLFNMYREPFPAIREHPL